MARIVFKGKFLINRLMMLVIPFISFILSLLFFIFSLSIQSLTWTIVTFCISFIIFYNALPRDISLDYKSFHFYNPLGKISSNLNIDNIISAKISHYKIKENPFIYFFSFGFLLNLLDISVSNKFRILVIIDNEMNEHRIYDFSYNGFNKIVKKIYDLNRDCFYSEVEEVSII